MKKILGISLVAVLAVSPLMARAENTLPNAYEIGATESGITTKSNETPVAAAGKLFKGKTVTDADRGAAATAAYVKGAYNAALSAVNALGDTVTDNFATKEGVDATVNKATALAQNVSLDVTGTVTATGLAVDTSALRYSMPTQGNAPAFVNWGDDTATANTIAVAVDTATNLSSNNALTGAATTGFSNVAVTGGVATGSVESAVSVNGYFDDKSDNSPDTFPAQP